MFRNIFIGLTFLFCTSINAPTALRPVFGVRVSYQADGSFVNILAYLHDGRVLTKKKVMSFKEFCHVASGDWPSIYNPTRENLFDKEGVTGGIYQDSITLKKYPYCPAMDSLWKLRYRSYPFPGNNELGWSQNAYNPSNPQKRYLYLRYGIEQIDTHQFIDTSFWKILRDVRDITWIGTYMNVQ